MPARALTSEPLEHWPPNRDEFRTAEENPGGELSDLAIDRAAELPLETAE